ncbi:MAG: conjugal transfer protein TraX [Ruminococcaceae bacterium]|nr:conjugal transfer protein TraX [Oscillospiraceae bacterium]
MQKFEMTSFGLKRLAIATMFIDHLAFAVLPVLMMGGFLGLSDSMEIYNILYYGMRIIGRIAFPIFAFQIVEGIKNTKNIKRYLGSLMIFGIISEIPFDLAFFGVPFYWNYQNVFFTLALGMIAVLPMHFEKNIFVKLATLIPALAVSHFIKCDYGIYGVLTVVLLYLLRKNKIALAVIGSVFTMLYQFSPTVIISFAAIYFYKGKRGRGNKWFYYCFYPAHLLLIYLLIKLIKI